MADNISVIIQAMQYKISYYTDDLEIQVLALPETLLARKRLKEIKNADA